MASSERKEIASTFSVVNKLLLESSIIDEEEKGALVLEEENSFDHFKNITQKLIRIIKKVDVSKTQALNYTASMVRDKVTPYFETVGEFREEWKSIGIIQPIYSELTEIGKLATMSFIDCTAIDTQEEKGDLPDSNIDFLLRTAGDLLENFQEERLILVLTNYFKMEEDLKKLREAAEKESGYTEKEKQKRLFLWGVFYAVIGVVLILLSTIVISFLVGCGGSLPFLTYFYTCLSGSVSATTITSVSIATEVAGITASCYSCAVTMGPFFGFFMYRLIEWCWKPTEFQEAIKVLVKEIENFLTELNKDFVKFQQSSGASSNVTYLSRAYYIEEKVRDTSVGKVAPPSTMLVLLKGLDSQSLGSITDAKAEEDFTNIIKNKLNVPLKQISRLPGQLAKLFEKVKACTDSIDEFEKGWPIDGSSGIKLYLTDVVKHVVNSYVANFNADFRIKDTAKQDALIGILVKLEELLKVLNNNDIVVILAKYFEMKGYLDDLKRHAETDAGWSEEKKKAALYLCGIVTALIAVVAIFLLAAAFYFWLHLGGAFYFGHFLITCLKGASAVAAGCYSFACIVGPAVSYLFYGHIIDKIFPKSSLQIAIAGLTTGTNRFIKALGDYSKTLKAKKEISEISESMRTIAEKKGEASSPFATPSPVSKPKQEVSQQTPYFSRHHYLLLRTAEKKQDTAHRAMANALNLA